VAHLSSGELGGLNAVSDTTLAVGRPIFFQVQAARAPADIPPVQDRKGDTKDVGTAPPVVTVVTAACLAWGVGLLIAAVVTVVHLHDWAGATTATVFGVLFLLGARYVWSLRHRPTIQLNDEGIVFHADVDPVMRLLTGKRTVTFRWEDIEAVEAQRHRNGVTLFLDLDGGPEQGRRLIPIAFPGGEASLLDEMRRRADGKRPLKPTQWVASQV
jgi:hypothetical protein